MSAAAGSPAFWRWSLAAGAAAFACAWGFGRIPGLTACGDTGGLSPIIAFEFARTPAEVAALFGGEPCRSALAAAQRTGLWLDAIGFIPAYTAFLSLAARALAGRWALPIIAGLVIAGLADEIEGVVLFRILDTLPGTQALLDALFWAVRLKFLLLGLATGMVAVLLVATLRQVAAGFGIVAAFGAAQALLGFFEPAPADMMRGFTLGWVSLLVVALIASVAPWLVSAAPASRPRAPTSPSA